MRAVKKVLLIAILSSVTFIGACSKGGASSAAVASSDDLRNGKNHVRKEKGTFRING